MSISTLSVQTTWSGANDLQATVSTPTTNPEYSDSTPTQYQMLTVALPAAGTSVLLPVPPGWTRVTDIHVQNIHATGYCVLHLNATTGAPYVQLAPSGGQFACSLGASVPSGGVALTPSTTWTLASCDSAGVLANGVATMVYIYMAGV